MSFIVYDVTFLVVFTLLVVAFLYTHRQNLKREGILYLYRTKVGLKVIEWTSKRFAWLLRPSQYLVIACGYILMIAMVWFLAKFTYAYMTSPLLAEQLRIPVLTPLVPYIDQLFKVDFLPPFYFTYWIIIIAIIAIPHEFAHGIYARLNKIKIHSTGFGFLGPFLAAFVEQDEKDMNKAKKFHQLSVLAAGTFANVLMTILFGLLLWAFVAMAFVPAGVYFTGYATSQVNTGDVASIEGIPLLDVSDSLFQTDEQFFSITTKDNRSYLSNPETIKDTLAKGISQMIVYDDAPAVRMQLRGAITHVNGQPVRSYEELKAQLASHQPDEEITLTTVNIKNQKIENKVTLSNRNGQAFLGVAISPPEARGIRGLMYKFIGNIKDPLLYYESTIGDMGTFIYDLLWWTVIINISVALCNMLPVGIFDGGRFFYLTVWGITSSKKFAERAFKASTWIALIIVTLLMLKWVFAVF